MTDSLALSVPCVVLTCTVFASAATLIPLGSARRFIIAAMVDPESNKTLRMNRPVCWLICLQTAMVIGAKSLEIMSKIGSLGSVLLGDRSTTLLPGSVASGVSGSDAATKKNSGSVSTRALLVSSMKLSLSVSMLSPGEGDQDRLEERDGVQLLL